MSLRWNGSTMGKANLSTSGSPSGAWSLSAQGIFARQKRWPISLPVTANLFLHIDASKPSTVTLNGSQVNAIADLSPANKTVGQTIAARQPFYITNQNNGLNVIRFNSGQQSFLDVTSTTIPASHTVFAAIQKPFTFIHFVGLATYTTSRYSCIWENNAMYQSSNAAWTAHTTNATTGWVLVTVRRTDATQIRVRVNGTNSDVTTGSGVTDPVNGAWNAIGRRSVANYSNYDLGEMLAYDAALSDSDVDAVEAYLAAKWNI